MQNMTMAAPAPTSEEEPIKPGCKYQPIDIQRWGMQPFVNVTPERPDPNNTLTTSLTLDYTTANIAGCEVHLRTYNGALIGPTWRNQSDDHGQGPSREQAAQDRPVSDASLEHAGDGIQHHQSARSRAPRFAQRQQRQRLRPGLPSWKRRPSSFDYQFNLGQNNSHQPPGTNWYHSHLHGSTALQVSSTVEGAIIIEGGQDELPQIKAIRDMGGEQVMMLQKSSTTNRA